MLTYYPTRFKPSFWIAIKEKNVLNHLLKHKKVFYIASNRRTGLVRIKKSRDSETIAVGFISLVGHIRWKNREMFIQKNGSKTIEPLSKYVKHSGYPTYPAWKNAIKQKGNPRVSLYKIELL